MNACLPPSGFLIVLEDSGESHPLNPRYAGADRLPPYYLGEDLLKQYPEEAQAVDDYVFGGYKHSDYSIITDYSKALELFRRFSQATRKYELLFCGSGPDDPLLISLRDLATNVPLGYDISGISGDCWSIVGDLSTSEWAKPYLARLNDNGLFHSRDDAERYLKEYRREKEHNGEDVLKTVFVVRIVPRSLPISE
jgi:hypothetical protein